jgi:hypothetical protein
VNNIVIPRARTWANRRIVAGGARPAKPDQAASQRLTATGRNSFTTLMA